MKTPTLEKEQALLTQGFSVVAGIDEAGRGAWAGPVVAAAVILPAVMPNTAEENMLLAALNGVRDSKLMTAKQRLHLFSVVQETALAYGVGVASSTIIDQDRIISATRLAMHQAVSALTPPPDYLLIDALPLPDLPIKQDAFPKADQISLTVASASILAKVTRDQLMIDFDETYPGYAFAKHKGYGTKAHRAAIQQLGPCDIHRLSFAPFRDNT
ncbi:MAG: ribonuclease HII [Chloroflexota bacterium]